MLIKFQFIFFILLLFTSCGSEQKQSPTDKQTKQTASLKMNKTGESLFKKTCNSCHINTMVSEMTAPPLGGVLEKRGKAWTYAYTRNAWAMYEQGDSIAASLRAKGWGMMPTYENLSDADLDSLYAYIEYQYQLHK
jgi:mono/diheme cytochrome c family protein